VRLLRTLHTVRHLRARQLAYRAYYWLRPAPALSFEVLPNRSADHAAWTAPPLYPDVLTGDESLQIFGKEWQIRSEDDWDRVDWPLLVRYNIHYFHALQGRSAASRTVSLVQLMARWIDEVPAGTKVAWGPYPTSLRISNWVKWSLSGHPLELSQRASLCAQARKLSRHVEWHLMGNHLFANAKALVLSGLYFEGQEADHWYRQGLQLLTGEVAEQILADGGHFERSPMYHSLIVEDLLDVLNVLRVYTKQSDFRWDETVSRMLEWLVRLCHPDGQIGLFNDAAFNVAPEPRQLIDYAVRLGFEAPSSPIIGGYLLEATGYFRHQTAEATTLVDVAAIGPDYIPGHAHADTLTFEFSLGQQRIFVDTGTSAYTPLDVRSQERATTAHNTLSVDGANSSEVWSSFRVARRARVSDIEWSTDRLAAAHNGFCRLPGVGKHRREWNWHDRGLVFFDHVEGRGKHDVEFFLHCHPDCVVSQDGRWGFRVTSPDKRDVCVQFDEKLTIELSDGAYAENFGDRRSNQVMLAKYQGPLPLDLKTHISW